MPHLPVFTGGSSLVTWHACCLFLFSHIVGKLVKSTFLSVRRFSIFPEGVWRGKEDSGMFANIAPSPKSPSTSSRKIQSRRVEFIGESENYFSIFCKAPPYTTPILMCFYRRHFIALSEF